MRQIIIYITLFSLNASTFAQNNLYTREWGTYLNNLYLEDTDVDSNGNIWIVARANFDFGYIEDNYITPNAYQAENNGITDVLLACFSPSGELIYGTFFGGEGNDFQLTLAVRNNSVVIGGVTTSFTNISSPDAFDSTKNTENTSSFIAKFNLNGDLEWSTYFEGNKSLVIFDIALTNEENIIVTSITQSNDLGTSGTFKASIPPPYEHNDVLNFPSYPLVSKFDSEGNYLWGSYYGPDEVSVETQSSNIFTWDTVAQDNSGYIYFIGSSDDNTGFYSSAGSHQGSGNGLRDFFIAKFDQNGNRVWGTYYGGTGMEGFGKIEILRTNALYIAGTSNSPNHMATPNTFNENNSEENTMNIVAKFDLNGNQVWGTYLNEVSGGFLPSFAMNASFDLFILNYTAQNDDLLTYPVFQDQYGGMIDGNLLKLSEDGALNLYNSYYGGGLTELGLTGSGLEFDAFQNLYLAGRTFSSNNISTPNSFIQYFEYNSQGAGFIAKFIPCPEPIIPTGESIQLFNVGETVANLDIITQEWTGGEVYITWYSDAEGTQEIGTDTALQDGQTYYVSQAIQGCPES